MKEIIPEYSQCFLAAMMVQDVLVRRIEASNVCEDTFGRSGDERRYGGTCSYFNLWKRSY